MAVTPPKSKANGAWGQYIEILPAWDIVTVRTARQSDFNLFLYGIEDRLDELGLKFW